MSKVKEFWKKNKEGIIIVSSLTVSVSCIVIGGIITRKTIRDLPSEIEASSIKRNIISWYGNRERVINLETVKKILEANKDNLSQFAIFKEGINPDEYECIVLNNCDKFVFIDL